MPTQYEELARLAPLVGKVAADFDVDPASMRPPGETAHAGGAWETLYRARGAFLWYPYDAAVRLVRRHLARAPLDGTILDHGCGAGNHLEFFTRLGLRAIGTEIAPSALDLVRMRFSGAMMRCPPLHLVDAAAPLAPQLPRYDHVFSWLAACYGPRGKVIADIAALVDALPAGGAFFLALPARGDVAFRDSEPLPDGSRRIVSNISGQHGLVVTIPADAGEMAAWARGIDIRDAGDFGWTIGGVPSAFHFVYGTKA